VTETRSTRCSNRQLSTYLTYDSSPPSGGENEDYGFITSLNYNY
jgi:hypothetical protein